MAFQKFSMLVVFFSIITLAGCSQAKPIQSEIIGIWEWHDTSGKSVMEILEKSRVKVKFVQGSGHEFIGEGTYTIEPFDKQTSVVTMNITMGGIPSVSDWLIRFIDHNTMKMQIVGINRPMKWEKETNNTIEYKRK
jgi:hypothetical protein